MNNNKQAALLRHPGKRCCALERYIKIWCSCCKYMLMGSLLHKTEALVPAVSEIENVVEL
ncbi:hypothetical protein M2105_000312 [Paenibacillus sp. PastF-1]|nr:hypothetical protein [Paenibacillus sp. PastF-2]MDF9845897.1 hypothetical protein [Paenibacillus sp. PastM-2]MDF9852470.1 hypothetical protein [Paenibacillus sp. PastF-1]MDH6477800.1 hypothetical protein [Paenibacillus sp. PastH-2]MDH6505539.1 hypothetical protein [Paenibacillus sp. PastM-3]